MVMLCDVWETQVQHRISFLPAVRVHCWHWEAHFEQENEKLCISNKEPRRILFWVYPSSSRECQFLKCFSTKPAWSRAGRVFPVTFPCSGNTRFHLHGSKYLAEVFPLYNSLSLIFFILSYHFRVICSLLEPIDGFLCAATNMMKYLTRSHFLLDVECFIHFSLQNFLQEGQSGKNRKPGGWKWKALT